MSNQRIVIKAAFADCINRILSINTEKVPEEYLTKVVGLDNTDSKEKILRVLSDCLSFKIYDGYIEATVKRSKEELQEHLKHEQKVLDCSISQLKKWFSSSEDNKAQIETYLKFKGLHWILNKLK